jgi:hypothetical protein
MANTYAQIYIQIVFAVQGRQRLIRPQHNDELQKYMTGIINRSLPTELVTFLGHICAAFSKNAVCKTKL